MPVLIGTLGKNKILFKIMKYEVHFRYRTYSDSLGPRAKVNSV